MMRQERSRPRLAGLVLAALLAGAIVAPSARAADPEPRVDMEEFKKRLDEAWNEMMRELGPTIDSLGALIETLDRIDGLENYESPEVLPNGDILIRRKADAPPLPEPKDDAAPEAPADSGPGIKT